MKYLLKDTMETKYRGRPVYLKCNTGIGPAYTDDLAEAMIFDSKDEAVSNPAFLHSMCFFEPVELAKEQPQ